VRSYLVTMEPAARGRAPAARRPGRRLALGAAALALAAGAAVWGFYLRAPVPRVEVASEARMAFPLPAKPSVAVLAFENLSGDPGQEFLADGIAENIISALSKVRDLFVIARQATFAYKGKPVKVQRVAEELGVRYVLTGSFQRAGDRARITAQLVDALTGRQLWSERYDQEVKDIFDLQDAITLSVVTSLQVRLTEGEQALVWRRSTNSLAAWEHHWRALGLLFEFTKEKNLQARELWEKAVGLDPAFALAWTYLAWTYWQDARLGWSPSPSRSFAKAAELAEKARALDPSLPDTYSLLALIRLVAREHEEAVAMARRAVDLGPNLSFGVARLGYVLVFAGRPEEAVGQIRRAMRLMPNHPTWYLFALAEAYRLSGRYTEMIAVSQKLVELTPAQIDSRMQLAYAHVQLGQEGKARAHVAEILKVHPGYSASLAKPGWAKAWPFKDRREIDRIFDALRRAGLPE
jgi:adenylate cyclase